MSIKTYDWIVVGGGITGTALAYELARQDFRVLLLDKDATLQNATRYSYGGLAYWSGTSQLTRQLCQEGIACHRHLSEELEADTQFRELDLLLTIDTEDDPEATARSYAQFAISPQLLSVEEACEREPLLNRGAIAGAIRFPHGHIHPAKTTQAYSNAFRRAGGEIQVAEVVKLQPRGDHRIESVKTTDGIYYAANTVVCAGGFSRSLLQATGVDLPLYFTHAELIETPPLDLKLRTLLMPADMQRVALESQASTPELDPLWDEPGHKLAPPILDPGATQFCDAHLCFGQLSRVLTNPYASIDAAASEAAIRKGVGKVLPALEDVPGTWHRCLIAFSRNSLPVVGALSNVAGIYVFSGFTNTLLFAPPLAKRFASWAAGQGDEVIAQLSPTG